MQKIPRFIDFSSLPCQIKKTKNEWPCLDENQTDTILEDANKSRRD